MKNNLVIVDIQPHDVGKFINFNMESFGEYANQYNKIYVLYNGDQFGWESESDMYYYYQEIGIDCDKCRFFDKGYSFFRDIMDSQSIDNESIVQTIKIMKQNNIRDIQDIDEDTYMSTPLSEYIAFDDIENHTFYYPDEVEDFLPNQSFDICGGEWEECLREVLVICDVADKEYNIIKKFCY